MIDDINIPTIERMLDIVKADGMFELVEVVEDKLAFLRRTDAPTIDPASDSWWLQGYNRECYEAMQRVPIRQRVVDALSSRLPAGIKDAVPASIKRWAWRNRS